MGRGLASAVAIGTLLAQAFLVLRSIRQKPRKQMNVVLRVVVGPGAGQDIPVPGPTFVIGRAPDCDLRPNCPWISHHHCELIVRKGGLVVRNTDRRHDTFVNSERVETERRLKSGDRISIGWNLFDVRFT
jgi:pSer/pThr/pTyr-binding forkhead associated (FHA) protein